MAEIAKGVKYISPPLNPTHASSCRADARDFANASMSRFQQP